MNTHLGLGVDPKGVDRKSDFQLKCNQFPNLYYCFVQKYLHMLGGIGHLQCQVKDLSLPLYYCYWRYPDCCKWEKDFCSPQSLHCCYYHFSHHSFLGQASGHSCEPLQTDSYPLGLRKVKRWIASIFSSCEKKK